MLDLNHYISASNVLLLLSLHQQLSNQTFGDIFFDLKHTESYYFPAFDAPRAFVCKQCLSLGGRDSLHKENAWMLD